MEMLTGLSIIPMMARYLIFLSFPPSISPNIFPSIFPSFLTSSPPIYPIHHPL